MGAIYAQASVLFVSILFCSIILSIVIILLAMRHQLRLMRTQERKVIGGQRRLNENVEHLNYSIQRSIFESRDQNESNRITTVQTLQRSLDTHTAEIESTVDKVDQRVRTASQLSYERLIETVRHSTNEIEALVQIFSKFSGSQHPMPRTGGWAIDAQGLGQLISLVEQRQPQRILEFGSGASTVWLGYLTRAYGGKVVAVDHLQEYFEKTRRAIELHGIENQVELRLAPLEDTYCDDGNYQWYSSEAIQDLSDIDMVIVDGPPAGTGPKARYPAVPKVFDALGPRATIILDDAHRPDEKEIVEAWCSQHPELTILNVGVPGLAVLQRGYDQKY